MGRAFTAFCCFIVALQLLIGVPVAVCLAFMVLYGGLGPIAVEIHPGPTHLPHAFMHAATVAPPSFPLTVVPPPNVIPPAHPTAIDNPILEARDQHGSPFAGTVLTENTPPTMERDLFVAAFQKVASEAVRESTVPAPTAEAAPCPAACPAPSSTCCEASTPVNQADQFAIQHLYEIADSDERAGSFERADQWRALAREIRRGPKQDPADSPPAETTPAEPPAFDLP